jgi:aryl-alcohol dehydrogenase-like predicted oxidoreductase
MRTRKLGYSDLHLTTVGLGTAAIGGGRTYGRDADEAEAIAAIHRALDLGVNWIDTAPVYGYGHAEEVVRRALVGRRERVIIATKCGSRWDAASGTRFSSLRAASIREEVEDSLRRLGVESIDLYQIHWPHPDEQIEEGWSTIADLIREGKVRYGGVSNFSLAQLERVQAIHPVASLQPPYSLIDRRIEDGVLDYCAANGIGVIVYSPMGSGLLTGNLSREDVEALPETDWRRRTPHFREPNLSANLALVERLRPLAARKGWNLGQLAIAWVLRRPEVTAAIVGARRPAQIEETAPAGDFALSADEIAEIEALWRASQEGRHG